jgi:hypothetical protein
VANCPICHLPPPTPQTPSCTAPTGGMPTFTRKECHCVPRFNSPECRRGSYDERVPRWWSDLLRSLVAVYYLRPDNSPRVGVRVAIGARSGAGRRHESIRINGCSAGVALYDSYALFETSIAQQISNQTQRGVYAYVQGVYFSVHDAAHATSSNYTGEPNPLPASLPLYLVPNGLPGHKPAPMPFTPR